MLARVLEHLFQGIDLTRDVVLRDDGGGPFIATWRRIEPQPTASEILAATLPATKAQRITSINTECRARLLARFGDPAEQVSRSIGVYGLAEKSALETGIAATIDATNVASDAVTAATTLAEVEAVAVTWPVI